MNVTCVAEAAVDYCDAVWANPDISGIGVRIAVYVQAGLNVLATTAFRSNVQLTRDAARTSYVLSIGLILASITQWRIGGMGLFDALVGVQLATLMTVFMLFNIRYLSTLGLSINISTTLFLVLYTHWGVQTWTFPPCPSNDLTLFVIFGRSVPATNPGLKIFALVVFGFVGLVTVGAIGMLLWWCAMVHVHRGEVNARTAAVWINHKREQYDSAGKSHISALLPLPIMICLAISTEQTVARNQAINELSILDEWTFGQTLAVVMLLTQVVEAGLWMWKKRQWKRELEWRGKSGSGRDVGLPVL